MIVTFRSRVADIVPPFRLHWRKDRHFSARPAQIFVTLVVVKSTEDLSKPARPVEDLAATPRRASIFCATHLSKLRGMEKEHLKYALRRVYCDLQGNNRRCMPWQEWEIVKVEIAASIRIRKEIAPYIASPVREKLLSLSDAILGQILDIRALAGRPVTLVTPQGRWFLGKHGSIVQRPDEAFVFDHDAARKTFQLVTFGSTYALEEELRNGFITLKGGHRVGLAGKMTLGHDGGFTLREVTGFIFRVSREIKGCADAIMPYCISQDGLSLLSTLIISPPGAGKTTILRDMIRQASYGISRLGFPGSNIAVIDERNEIAACHEGEPQLDVGPTTVVLDRCPKARGLIMALRTLSPSVIATDEIGGREDLEALREALNAGVSVLATAHAGSLKELCIRRGFMELLEEGAFPRIVLLSRVPSPGTISGIYDNSGRCLSDLDGEIERAMTDRGVGGKVQVSGKWGIAR